MAILVTRNARFNFPAGTDFMSGVVTLQLAYDMYPQWLRVAAEHAEQCMSAAAVVDKLWTDGTKPEQIQAIEAELRSGMQAAVASVVALDGFYGTVKVLAPIPPEVAKKWRSGRVARYRQVAETFRRSFKIDQRVATGLRDHLKSMFNFRDEAVHSTGEVRDTVPHPRLNVGTERRLAMFSGTNAVNLATSSLNIIGGMMESPMPKHKALVAHCSAVGPETRALRDEWVPRLTALLKP